MKKILFKINNLLVLFILFLKYPFRRRASVKNRINTVIVFHDGKLGDMVCATPVFRAIKKNYKDSKLVVFGDRVNKDVVEYNSDVDDYIVADKQDIFLNSRTAKKYNADFACVLTPSFNNLATALLSDISLISVPCVVGGWSPYETFPYKIARTLVHLTEHVVGNYAPGEYLKLLKPIGINEVDTKKYLGFSNESDSYTQEIMGKYKCEDYEYVVCVAPGVGNIVKKWQPNKFAILVDKITKNYNAIVFVVGGPRDMEDVKDMMSSVENKESCIDLSGQLNVDQLKAFISKMSMFISVDTGPVYIAEAFGVPTIDIIGPMDEREQPPTGEFNKLVYIKNRKKSQLHIMNARVYDVVEARRQIDGIVVEDVWVEFVDLVSKIKNK